jgi:hypothetical protein
MKNKLLSYSALGSFLILGFTACSSIAERTGDFTLWVMIISGITIDSIILWRHRDD